MYILEKWWIESLKTRLVVNEKDGSILVEIPAGDFEMGDGEKENCPNHRVYLDRYFIGVYAVTNRQYKSFVDETGHKPPDVAKYGKPIWKGKSYPESYANHPVVCVSWNDAQAYCKWAGLTLPTETQWEKAARGPGNFIYPWGNDWNDTLCHHSCNRESENTAPVYDHPQGVSGYGHYNTSGNVWEWCRSRYDSDYCQSSPKQNLEWPSKASNRVLRGGGWSSSGARLCRSAYRGRSDPSGCFNYRGFRVVLAPGQKG